MLSICPGGGGGGGGGDVGLQLLSSVGVYGISPLCSGTCMVADLGPTGNLLSSISVGYN